MTRREVTIRIRRLADEGQDNDYANLSATDCIGLMWQLALDAWAFMGEPVAEPGLPRHVVRVIRRAR